MLLTVIFSSVVSHAKPQLLTNSTSSMHEGKASPPNLAICQNIASLLPYHSPLTMIYTRSHAPSVEEDKVVDCPYRTS